MRIAHLFTGDDGRSHFEDVELRLDFGQLRDRTPLLPVDGIDFRRSAERSDTVRFHNVSRRQFVVTLEGVLEVECGDGTKRRFTAGDVFFAEDRTGEGHSSRHVEGERRSIVIPVADDFDFGALLV